MQNRGYYFSYGCENQQVSYKLKYDFKDGGGLEPQSGRVQGSIIFINLQIANTRLYVRRVLNIPSYPVDRRLVPGKALTFF